MYIPFSTPHLKKSKSRVMATAKGTKLSFLIVTPCMTCGKAKGQVNEFETMHRPSGQYPEALFESSMHQKGFRAGTSADPGSSPNSATFGGLVGHLPS